MYPFKKRGLPQLNAVIVLVLIVLILIILILVVLTVIVLLLVVVAVVLVLIVSVPELTSIALTVKLFPVLVKCTIR